MAVLPSAGNTVSSVEHIRAGRLRALAVTTATRSDALPDLPTIGEFVQGYEASGWWGFGAPKNIPSVRYLNHVDAGHHPPAEIVEKLNMEINAGLADLKMKAHLADLGGTALPGSCPPAASTLPLIGGTTAGPAAAHDGGVAVAGGKVPFR
jgi:hypothetical protein